MMRPNGVEKQVRPSGWKPGANTIAYWKFENNLNDSSGNQNDLTANAYVYSYDTGVDGYCCKSGSDYFNLSSPLTDSIFAGNFTLMFFIKYTTINPVMRIMGCATVGGGGNGAYTNIQYESGSGGLQWYNYNSAGRTSWSWTPVADAWYHIAITGDGTSYTAYLDGATMNKIQQGTVSQGGANFYLFCNNWTQGNNANSGSCFDEVIIEDKIWAQQDIQNYLANFTY